MGFVKLTDDGPGNESIYVDFRTGITMQPTLEDSTEIYSIETTLTVKETPEQIIEMIADAGNISVPPGTVELKRISEALAYWHDKEHGGHTR